MGVSYLVEATDIFFTFGGFPRFVEVGETVKKNCLARPSEKICLKYMLLVISGMICNDLETFWSDFRDFGMQNHSVQ